MAITDIKKIELKSERLIAISMTLLQLAECKHWACNVSDSRCIGCGAVICPSCLKEPDYCKCENKHECCKS